MKAVIRGYVENIKDNNVSGWCYAPNDPDPVVVSLYIGDIFIRSRRANNVREDIARGGGPLLAGFNFRISPELRALLPEGAQARILVGPDAYPLPLLKGKTDIVNGGATDGGADLKAMLADKFHIDHWGNLHICFAKEPGKIERLLDFYCELRPHLRTIGDVDIYLTGGNLLGLIREFAFLPHDDDIDAAFCIPADTPEEAADAFFDHFDRVVPKLMLLGYGVHLMNVGQYHIYRGPDRVLDIFIGWITRDGRWYRYVGAGGEFGSRDFRTREIDYLGRTVLIPQYAETELDLTYGEKWKSFDPHFAWTLSKDVREIIVRFEKAGAERTKARQALLRNPRTYIEEVTGPNLERISVAAEELPPPFVAH